MKKIFTMGVALVAAVVFAAVSPAQAACTLDTQVVFHGLDSFFEHCTDNQNIFGYAYLISAPGTTNSNGQDIVCEDNVTVLPSGGICQFFSGVRGDGQVTIQYDWGAGNPGSLGCPNANAAGPGSTPIAIQVVDNDGKSVVTELHFDENVSGFTVEQAHPYDGTNWYPLSCGPNNGPTLVGAVTANQACVNVPVPQIYSDCDAGTVGEALGLCATSGLARSTTARGRLYTRQAPCGQSPDPRISTGWTLMAVSPDVAGNACNTFAPATPGNCNYIGATGVIGGGESAAVLGSFQVPAPGAAIDRVKIVKAAYGKGTLLVNFITEHESTIVGFNVYAGETKLNRGLIAAKGTGDNAYSFQVGRGAVKGNRTVVVEAITNTGASIKSAPASVK